MSQVSSPLLTRRALAKTILRVRTGAYLILAITLLAAWIADRDTPVYAVFVLVAAVVLPMLDRSIEGWHRVEIAVALDVIISALAWWRVPGDPVLALVIALWAVAVGAFFCGPDLEKLLIGMIVFVETAKLPLAASVFAGRFGQGSFFREMFAGEWAVQAALTAGRLAIILATYLLFRTVARTYRSSQDAIEESEARYRSLVETSPSALLVVQAGRIVFANPAALGLLGSESMVTGSALLDFLAAERHAAARDHLEEAERYGTPQQLPEWEIVTASGTTRHADITLAPTLHEGHPAVQVIIYDATDRYRATQVLAASEERYREFFERLPVALYRTAPDGRILDANQEAIRLLGATDKEALVNTMADRFYVDSDDRTLFARAIRRHGAVLGQEVPMRRATGEIIWIRDSARVVHTEDGIIYEGALIDVTDRRRAEQEVHARAEQQEAVARIGHLALTGAGLHEIFEATAAAMADELAADVATVVRCRPDGELAMDAEAGRRAGAPGELIAPGDAPLYEFVLGAGEPVLVSDIASEPRFGPSAGLIELGVTTACSVTIPGLDRPIGCLAAYRAIPQEFTPDDVHFLESLANVVGAAVQRQAAAEQLEALVRSKDQFVAAVSHEVRTPLTVVSGLAQELLERWEEFGHDEIHELVGLIVDQSRDMSDLIEDLLVSARADIGKLEIRPEPVRLAAQMDAILETLEPESRRRIVRDRGPDDSLEVTVSADPVRLRQIIRNLVTNALKYGGPAIRICAMHDPSTVTLEVRDDGVELPEEHRERIFEPYHQAHEVKGLTSSVGLGLAVSRTLAEMMGGTLTYCHDGESVFRLTIPRSDAGAHPPVDEQDHDRPDDRTDQPGRREVEDLPVA